MSKELLVALYKLKDALIKLIKEENLARKINPEENLFIRWKWKNFRYTEKGIETDQGETEKFTQKNWWKASEYLSTMMSETSQYQDVLKQLVILKIEKSSQKLDNLIVTMANKFLNASTSEETVLNEIIERFYRELIKGGFKSGVNIQLEGIIPLIQEIEILPNIHLRQATEKDIERTTHFGEEMLMAPSFHQFSNPSAILSMEFENYSMMQLQIEVWKSIAILKLFKVGSVRDLSYRPFSDSFFQSVYFGTHYSREKIGPIVSYKLDKQDIVRLQKFWSEIYSKLPINFYRLDSINLDTLSLAYNKYCDALFLGSSLENQISTTISGLEALILENEAELSYRLCLRIAKFMGFMNQNPMYVRRVMKEAYSIRSCYSHGSFLSEKEKKKLETKFISIKDIGLLTLDYLRIILLFMMLTGISKNEFIKRIEDCLLDDETEKSLMETIASQKKIIL